MARHPSSHLWHCAATEPSRRGCGLAHALGHAAGGAAHAGGALAKRGRPAHVCACAFQNQCPPVSLNEVRSITGHESWMRWNSLACRVHGHCVQTNLRHPEHVDPDSRCGFVCACVARACGTHDRGNGLNFGFRVSLWGHVRYSRSRWQLGLKGMCFRQWLEFCVLGFRVLRACACSTHNCGNGLNFGF